MRNFSRLSAIVAAVCLCFSTSSAAAAQTSSSDSALTAAIRASAEHPRPGDRVWLHVWREPKLSDTVLVDERGDVLLPKIGIVNAAAMPMSDFRDTVRRRFGEFLRDSPVDVVVLRRVAVNGAVNKPNVYYVDVSATLRDVIAQAGGISESGAENRVAILRGGQTIRVPDWKQAQSAADLRSGDQVIVGRKSWIAMNLLPLISVSTVVASLIISLARR